MSGIFDRKFIIGVGVEKCGTTSIHRFLEGTGQFAMPKHKETFFFNRHFARGGEYYRALYDEAADDLVHVDITPSYFRSGQVLSRIRETMRGDLNVMLFIRNPLQRAFSHYWFEIVKQVIHGRRSDKFAFPLEYSFERFAEGGNKMYFCGYSSAIAQLRKLFGEAFSVFVFEDLVESHEGFCRKLAQITGREVGEFTKYPLPRSNERRYLRLVAEGGKLESASALLVLDENGNRVRRLSLSQEQVRNALLTQATFTHALGEEAYAKLNERMFGTEIGKLEQLLDSDLSSWRRPRVLRVL